MNSTWKLERNELMWMELLNDAIAEVFHVTYEFNWRCGIMPGITWRCHGFSKQWSKNTRIAPVSSSKTPSGLSEKYIFLPFFAFLGFFDTFWHWKIEDSWKALFVSSSMEFLKTILDSNRFAVFTFLLKQSISIL